MGMLATWLPSLFGVTAASGGYATLAALGTGIGVATGAKAVSAVGDAITPPAPAAQKAAEAVPAAEGAPEQAIIATEAKRASLLRRRGMSYNIKSGGQGLLAAPVTGKKKLLGE